MPRAAVCLARILVMGQTNVNDPRGQARAAWWVAVATVAVALACLLGLQPAAARAAFVASPPTAGALYFDGPTDRYLLGGTWLYRADPADAGVSEGWWRAASTSGWTGVTVPNSYNAGDFSAASDVGYVGWYRRDFTLPPSAFPRYVAPPDRRWILRFEEVNYRASVWLNGRLIGMHEGASTPFEIVLPRLRGGVNRLVVRVDNRRGPLDLPPGIAGWWNYGGLLREVYLRAVAGIDIAQVQITPALPCPRCPATVEANVVVRNLTSKREQVKLTGHFGTDALQFGASSVAPGGSWNARATIVIEHPRLWSIDDPALYHVTLQLADQQGRALDSYRYLAGIRSITVTPGGRLELNGRPVNLRGVEEREQDLVEGGALDPAHLRRIITWIRDLGATLIRAETPNPEIEELADRAGLLIWSDIPVSGATATSLFADPGWLARAHTLLRTDILENASHPSILLWSIGNELPLPVAPEERAYIAGTAALARELDPSRPVGMAVMDWPGVPCQNAYTPLQVIGINEYFGWYGAGGGTTDDRDALSPFLDTVHACYPHQAVMVSEFGFEANRPGPIEERGTYQFQANSASYHLRVFDTKHWLSGAIYFCLQDAALTPGWGGGNPFPDPPFLDKGLIDVQGQPKPAFSVVAAGYHAARQIAPPAR